MLLFFILLPHGFFLFLPQSLSPGRKQLQLVKLIISFGHQNNINCSVHATITDKLQKMALQGLKLE